MKADTEKIQKIWDLQNHLTCLHNDLVSLKKEDYPNINRSVWGRIYNNVQHLSGQLIILGLLIDGHDAHPETGYPK